jgi:glycerate-2-kinase
MPAALMAHLDRVIAGEAPETPKPGDAAFALVDAPVIIGRSRLHAGVAQAMRASDEPCTIHDAAVVGEASERGRAMAPLNTVDLNGFLI